MSGLPLGLDFSLKKLAKNTLKFSQSTENAWKKTFEALNPTSCGISHF